MGATWKTMGGLTAVADFATQEKNGESQNTNSGMGTLRTVERGDTDQHTAFFAGCNLLSASS